MYTNILQHMCSVASQTMCVCVQFMCQGVTKEPEWHNTEKGVQQ